MKPQIGESYKNKDTYEGEGELIIASIPDEHGYIRCIHALHEKFKHLNGHIEHKHVEDIAKYYIKVT